jgi:hypothetical protein
MSLLVRSEHPPTHLVLSPSRLVIPLASMPAIIYPALNTQLSAIVVLPWPTVDPPPQPVIVTWLALVIAQRSAVDQIGSTCITILALTFLLPLPLLPEVEEATMCSRSHLVSQLPGVIQHVMWITPLDAPSSM